jgi:uncharacterized protein YlxW (UPF0749 family)
LEKGRSDKSVFAQPVFGVDKVVFILYNQLRFLNLQAFYPSPNYYSSEVPMNRKVSILAATLLFSSSMLLVSCSSSPDEAQMKQLNDLKDEYAALQKEQTAKEQEKATLDREVAEKNAKLKKCNDDQQVVRQRLGK